MKVNITFNKKEYFFLAVANASDRQKAFLQMQKLTKNEPCREILQLKQELLLKLAIITDSEYKSLNVKKFMREEIMPLYCFDQAYDYELAVRDILSVDSVVLRYQVPSEDKMISSELKDLGFPEYRNTDAD